MLHYILRYISTFKPVTFGAGAEEDPPPPLATRKGPPYTLSSAFPLVNYWCNRKGYSKVYSPEPFQYLYSYWLICLYTGWPRKNATILIVNFKDIINKTELIFILLCGKFIFQQSDTMITNFGDRRLNPSAILVRQCHVQNLVLFWPHRTLEHKKMLTSRPPEALTEHLLWKRRQCEQTELFITQQLILWDAVKRNILAVPRIARIEKVANLENDIASLK